MQSLIDRGLRAHLATESLLTGQLAIELNFETDKKPPRYVGVNEIYPEFPTVPSALQQQAKVLKELPLKEMFEDVDDAIEGIDKLVNSPETIGAIREMGATLKEFRETSAKFKTQIVPLSSALVAMLTETRKLVKHLDSKVDPLTGEITNTLGDARKLVTNTDGRIENISSELLTAITGAQTAIKQFDKTLSSANGVIAEDSSLRYEIAKAIKELTAAARAIRLSAEYLRQHPESLLRGKPGTKGK